MLTPDFNEEYVNTESLMKAPADKTEPTADQKEAAASQKEASKAAAPSGDKKHEIVVEKSKKVETVAPGQIIPPASGRTPSKDTELRQRYINVFVYFQFYHDRF